MTQLLRRGLCLESSSAAPPSDELVRRLMNVYRRRGGLVTGDEMALAMRGHYDQPVSQLAHRIVERRLLSFAWHAQTYIPTFQFGRHPVSVLNGVVAVLDELAPAFDEYALAEWFATPNSWLQFRVPSVLVAEEPMLVLQAARADRYVATGW